MLDKRSYLIGWTLGVFALAGVSCASTDKQQLAVAAACLTYAKSLSELAPYRPKLDAKAVAIVEQVRATLNPVCLAPTPPSATEAATTAAMAGLGQLSTIIALVKN
jgi:hypothetical protein